MFYSFATMKHVDHTEVYADAFKVDFLFHFRFYIQFYFLFNDTNNWSLICSRSRSTALADRTPTFVHNSLVLFNEQDTVGGKVFFALKPISGNSTLRARQFNVPIHTQ